MAKRSKVDRLGNTSKKNAAGERGSLVYDKISLPIHHISYVIQTPFAKASNILHHI